MEVNLSDHFRAVAELLRERDAACDRIAALEQRIAALHHGYQTRDARRWSKADIEALFAGPLSAPEAERRAAAYGLSARREETDDGETWIVLSPSAVTIRTE